MRHRISYLDYLEQEALSIIEYAYTGLTDKPLGVLFSCGKDSCVVRHLVMRYLRNSNKPSAHPVCLSIDTGYNFEEVNDFLSKIPNCNIRYVQDSIDRGTVPYRAPGESRNADQAVTLKEAITEFQFAGLFCGARRDEDRARAKERVFSHRDREGNWRPERQRMEMYGYMTDLRLEEGEHFRIFPLSNWTEYDVWEYIARHDVEIPSLYFAHQREGYPEGNVRFRTVGDRLVTRPVYSDATSVQQILEELESVTLSERGATRMDDTAMSMEQRKRNGYF